MSSRLFTSSQDVFKPSSGRLRQKFKFQKTERSFCRWKSTDNNDTEIFLSLEISCTFFIAKEKIWKRIFNINRELSQNYTEKQIMPFKTKVNWLFNDLLYYLVIADFDWKFFLLHCHRFSTFVAIIIISHIFITRTVSQRKYCTMQEKLLHFGLSYYCSRVGTWLALILSQIYKTCLVEITIFLGFLPKLWS